MDGPTVPTGGDVILEVNGQPLNSLDVMLELIAFSNPGDEMELTILRDGERQGLAVTLDARPEEFGQFE